MLIMLMKLIHVFEKSAWEMLIMLIMLIFWGVNQKINLTWLKFPLFEVIFEENVLKIGEMLIMLIFWGTLGPPP